MSKARDLANAGTALTTVSATELGYLDGVTSAVQTQLNAKQATVSGVNDTEIGYLDGVTSAIQTQIDGKVASVSGTSGRVTSSGGTTPAIDLATSGATAGTYGSSSTIPQIAVDEYGRVTSVSNAGLSASSAMTLISRQNAAGSATVTFSSIPQTYRSLMVVWNSLTGPTSPSGYTDTIYFTFNGQTTGTSTGAYYHSRITGTNTTFYSTSYVGSGDSYRYYLGGTIGGPNQQLPRSSGSFFMPEYTETTGFDSNRYYARQGYGSYYSEYESPTRHQTFQYVKNGALTQIVMGNSSNRTFSDGVISLYGIG